MKALIFYTSVVLLFSCQERQSVIASTNEIELDYAQIKKLKNFEQRPILFYNVENLFDTINDPNTNDDEFTPNGSKEWSSERYLDKLSKLSRAIRASGKENPLLIGLAEVENNAVVMDLVNSERLAETKYSIAHFDSPDRRGIDVALAFDSERFFLLHKEAISVLMKNDSEFRTRDILYVKGVLKDSIPLHVFVNHWSSRYGGQKESEHKRILAATILRKKADSILALNPEAHIVFMGDFNDYPTNKSITEILEAKGIKDSKSTTFFNLFSDIHEKGKGTHNYKGEWGALDQIIVSNSLIEGKTLSVKGSEAHINYKDFLLYEHPNGDKTPSRSYGGPNYYGGYSDHLAVFIYLKMSAK